MSAVADKRADLTLRFSLDVPTQLPTHGQWWSNLAMQRLHTAQCLDLMGFRIFETAKYEKNNQFLVFFYRRVVDLHTKQVLQNMLRSRLPVSASSTIVCKEARHQSSDYENSDEGQWCQTKHTVELTTLILIGNCKPFHREQYMFSLNLNIK